MRTVLCSLVVRTHLKLILFLLEIQRKIDDDAVEYLKQCEWPGNIRELENMVQRLMISAKGEQITLLDVMRELHAEVFDLKLILFLLAHQLCLANSNSFSNFSGRPVLSMFTH